MNPFDLSGDSYIFDPRSEILAGPAKGETILVAECDPRRIRYAKVSSDVCGQYKRADLFSFNVNRQSLPELSRDENHVETSAPTTTGTQNIDRSDKS